MRVHLFANKLIVKQNRRYSVISTEIYSKSDLYNMLLVHMHVTLKLYFICILNANIFILIIGYI